MSCSGRGGLEQVPEAAGEVALEAADGFFGALALGAFAGDVVLGLGVAAQAGDGDAVDRRVDLAVAAAVSPDPAAPRARDRAVAAARGGRTMCAGSGRRLWRCGSS